MPSSRSGTPASILSTMPPLATALLAAFLCPPHIPHEITGFIFHHCNIIAPTLRPSLPLLAGQRWPKTSNHLLSRRMIQSLAISSPRPLEARMAKCLETRETVAIKKVLQDRRYKNRELQLMRSIDHPNVISLKHCFFSTTTTYELFLNLVMEYVPETLYRVLRHYSNLNQRMPLIYVKLYTYQLFRGLAYIHTIPGVCHKDVKPQNVLVDPLTPQIKLCDFGSTKVLVKGEANISYICSRYYRAPELIFGATEYATSSLNRFLLQTATNFNLCRAC